MNTVIKWGVVLALAGTMAAQAAPKKKAHKVVKAAEPAVTQQDVQALKDSLSLQQQAIETLKGELAKRDQNWQDAQQKLQQAQADAAAAQAKTAAVEASAEQDRAAYNQLASDMADVKTTLTNGALTTMDDQKRMTAFETAMGCFRFYGDIRVRGESFNQQGTADRNRARIRARFGVESKLGESFIGGLALATGTLGDPTTTNESLTNYFARKTIGLDRAYITYNPSSFKALQLTGGKFAYPWLRSGVTFDPDINPDGFSEKLSFDLHNPLVKNLTVGAYQLNVNEVSNGADAYALGVHASARLQPLPFWTATPSFSATKWNKPNQILNASAFAVGATTASFVVQLPIVPQPAPGSQQTQPTVFTLNVPGEGPGCSNPKITLSVDANPANPAKPITVPATPNCVFAPNGMTNAILFDVTTDAFGNVSKTNQRFASGFFYADFILNNTFKTPFKRLPLNVNLEYEDNLDAVSHPYSGTLDPVTHQLVQLTNLGSQSKAYGADISVGQTAHKGDFQIGYAYLRQEQDSAIASFVESDQRAPTNILQHRFYALYKLNANTTASFTFWRGRTLNTSLENAVIAPGVNGTVSQLDHSLNRLQFDLIYSF
jgi:hypothetical protein